MGCEEPSQAPGPAGTPQAAELQDVPQKSLSTYQCLMQLAEGLGKVKVIQGKAEPQALAPWCSLQTSSGRPFLGALESQGLDFGNPLSMFRVCFQALSGEQHGSRPCSIQEVSASALLSRILSPLIQTGSEDPLEA